MGTRCRLTSPHFDRRIIPDDLRRPGQLSVKAPRDVRHRVLFLDRRTEHMSKPIRIRRKFVMLRCMIVCCAGADHLNRFKLSMSKEPVAIVNPRLDLISRLFSVGPRGRGHTGTYVSKVTLGSVSYSCAVELLEFRAARRAGEMWVAHRRTCLLRSENLLLFRLGILIFVCIPHCCPVSFPPFGSLLPFIAHTASIR